MKVGNTLRCKVSGLIGIATARVEYLNGCVQFCIIPKSDGTKYPDGTYLDIGQLEFVDEGVSVIKKDNGGVMDNTPPVKFGR